MTDLEERVAALEAIVAGLAQPEPAFMSEVREAAIIRNRAKAIRLDHLPTKVTVEAPTRDEAVTKLGRALQRYAARHPEEATGAA